VSLLVVGGCGDAAKTQTAAAKDTATVTTNAKNAATATNKNAQAATAEKTITGEAQGTMQLEVKNNGQTFRVALNKSPAAQDFYKQLPLTVEVKNFSDNEKLFYPPQKLKTQDAVVAHATKGTLAYFIPWGNLTFFYKDYAPVSADLIEIGKVVSGDANLEKLSRKIGNHGGKVKSF
jgi:hypothetical protein